MPFALRRRSALGIPGALPLLFVWAYGAADIELCTGVPKGFPSHIEKAKRSLGVKYAMKLWQERTVVKGVSEEEARSMLARIVIQEYRGNVLHHVSIPFAERRFPIPTAECLSL